MINIIDKTIKMLKKTKIPYVRKITFQKKYLFFLVKNSFLVFDSNNRHVHYIAYIQNNIPKEKYDKLANKLFLKLLKKNTMLRCMPVYKDKVKYLVFFVQY